MRKPYVIFAAATLVVSGCTSKQAATPEHFLTTLNAWLPDHPDCLLDASVKFPYETGDPEQEKQLDALARAQILTANKAGIIKITRYTMTDTGLKAGAHLCYGHRVATEIVSFTPPAEANGFTETQVVYKYKLEDVPVWAKGGEVVGAYPKLSEGLSGNARDKKTLALTGVGWTVPD